MAYSKTKPYNRTSYKGAADPSYDRYLKEAVAAGKAENVKESELEKPYNVKQTYSAMQQDYQPITPPVIDPGPGTGGLKCVWTSTGCEQLVGCWAGSDIVLDGPEAATAGYMPVEVLTGELVSQRVGGGESRGIDIVMSSFPPRNIFNVKFKDGLGVIHTQAIDIECAISDLWTSFEIESAGSNPYNNISLCIDQANGHCHIAYNMQGNPYNTKYAVFDGTAITSEVAFYGLAYTGYKVSICLNGSNEPCIATFKDDYINGRTDVIMQIKSGGSWSETVIDVRTNYEYYTGITIFKDSSDYLHVIHGGTKVDNTDGKIFHSTNASGSWLTETAITLTPTLGGAFDTSYIFAVIDSADTIHIGYYFAEAGGPYDLSHISGTWGSWSVANSIYTGALSDISDMAISSNDTVGILADISPTRYFYKASGGAWSGSETVTNDSTMQASSLAFDNTNVARAAASKDESGVELIRDYSRTGGSWVLSYTSQLYEMSDFSDCGVYQANNVLYMVGTSSRIDPGIMFYYRYL